GPGRKEFESGFSSRTNVQLVVNVPEMPTHRAIRQTQPRGNLLVGKTLRQQFENFTLARGKTFDLGGGDNGFLEGNNNLPGNFTRHGSSALLNLANGGDQFVGSAAFQKVSTRSRAQRFENALRVFIDRHHDDLD